MKPFDYAIAENQQGALAAMNKGYRIKASGIDLLDMLKERTEKLEKLVSIHKLDDMKAITAGNDGITIGALATLRQIAGHDDIRRRYPALAEAAGEAATPQIRARATAGGNILQRPRCWYFRSEEFHCLKKGGGTCFAWDGENTYHSIYPTGPCRIVHPSNIAPCLVAVGARLKFRTPQSEKEVDSREFFINTDENPLKENTLGARDLLTAIVLDPLPEKSGYIEFREKQSFDWPLAACTAVYIDGRWSVVLSHVAPLPWRAVAAEKVLGTAGDVDAALAEKAADAAIADAAPMSQNAFRVKLARAAVRRAILKACGKEVL